MTPMTFSPMSTCAFIRSQNNALINVQNINREVNMFLIQLATIPLILVQLSRQ